MFKEVLYTESMTQVPGCQILRNGVNCGKLVNVHPE
jgi:hypothetical protein